MSTELSSRTTDDHGPRVPTGPGAGTELRFHEALTCRTAPAMCRAVRDELKAVPEHLWINLEDVKSTDVVGLAALLQSLRRAAAAHVPVSVLPSPAVYRAFLNAGILDDLPIEGPGAGPSLPTVEPEGTQGEPETAFVASTARLGLRPPAWEELGIFERWASEPLLEHMVGSELLYRCRHLGPYHPDFVAQVMHEPTALTLLVEPLQRAAGPIGFVRLYNVHPTEGFGFLETAVLHGRSLRASWGIEASRLFVAYAMDVIGIRRVEAKVYAYNVLSINSLRRNGFRQEGVLREARVYEGQRWDILVFAMLEREMREQRALDGFPDMGFWSADADR